VLSSKYHQHRQDDLRSFKQANSEILKPPDTLSENEAEAVMTEWSYCQTKIHTSEKDMKEQDGC